MQVYDNKHVERYTVASKNLSDCFVEEGKTLTYGANVIFYTTVATILCSVLGVIFDRTIFTFVLPFACIGAFGILNASVSLVKYNAWKKRHDAQTEFFNASKAVSEYNSGKVLELMALHETAVALDPDAPAEYRIIN
jgi:hypothetical protein